MRRARQTRAQAAGWLRGLGLLAALLASLGGCQDPDPYPDVRDAGGGADAGVIHPPDAGASVGDGGVMDGGVMDGGVMDGGVMDGGYGDGGLPDAGDGGLLDAGAPDAGLDASGDGL